LNLTASPPSVKKNQLLDIPQNFVVGCLNILTNKEKGEEKSGQRLLLFIEYSEIKKERRSPMQERYYDKRISAKLQAQIKKFSQRVTRGFKKPERKWIGEMLYGILKSKDVKLTHIGRALKEDTKMKHTEKRLSRNVSRKDISEKLLDSYLLIPPKGGVREETILSLDLSDISKKEAKKMENLCGVWNGSEGRNSNGYWLCTVVAKNIEEEEVIPLYNELYSSRAEDFKSRLWRDRYSKPLISSPSNLGIRASG
jgi:hypothetical protein